MKKIATIASVILVLLFLMPPCKANVVVSPTEISITMTDSFIEGNTTKKITVKNYFPYNISVKAWMMHPDIIEWMRPNKTFIDNLSWITIEPSEQIIPPNSSSYFYIYLAPLDNETKNETLGRHWEIWAALKINAASGNSSSSFKQGYNIRVYVDTPEQPSEPSESMFPEELIYYTVTAVALAILLVLIFYFYRQKKKKQ
ncbi:MAG: hypothetical protein QHH19_04550 [Candidatus Thermoplasmatota archaeon]|jgi:hypothetical protein|nr:hypothetical protein [Candidatus Thermoplasmatota archaeon]